MSATAGPINEYANRRGTHYPLGKGSGAKIRFQASILVIGGRGRLLRPVKTRKPLRKFLLQKLKILKRRIGEE